MDTRYLKIRIKESLLANTAIDFDSIHLQTDLSIDYYVDALYRFINLKAIVHSDFNIIFFFDFKTELIKLSKVKFEERNIFVNVEYKNLVTKRKHKIKYRFFLKNTSFSLMTTKQQSLVKTMKGLSLKIMTPTFVNTVILLGTQQTQQSVSCQ